MRSLAAYLIACVLSCVFVAFISYKNGWDAGYNASCCDAPYDVPFAPPNIDWTPNTEPTPGAKSVLLPTFGTEHDGGGGDMLGLQDWERLTKEERDHVLERQSSLAKEAFAP